MRTPVNNGRLYDSLPPVDAIVAAWIQAGPRPDWHQKAQREVADAMPLLARAIERLVQERRV